MESYSQIHLSIENDSECRLSPEQTLLAALLESALVDIEGNGLDFGETLFKVREKRSRALSWIYSESIHCSPELGISFGFVCEHLALDHVKVRVVLSSCVRAERTLGRRLKNF